MIPVVNPLLLCLNSPDTCLLLIVIVHSISPSCSEERGKETVVYCSIISFSQALQRIIDRSRAIRIRRYLIPLDSYMIAPNRGADLVYVDFLSSSSPVKVLQLIEEKIHAKLYLVGELDNTVWNSKGWDQQRLHQLHLRLQKEKDKI